MEKLEIYDAVREVPKAAQKAIGGGRLKGMTDINPMWRIKALTEQFGPCGFGWYYEITDKWLETTMAKDEITANVHIKLFVKMGNEWSAPIEGIGGSMLVASERGGLYVNDECYKMALTDAISVACKALGVGANIYWQSDNTKYNDTKRQAVVSEEKQTPATPTTVNRQGADFLMNLCVDTETDANQLMAYYKVTDFINMTMEQYDHACGILQARRDNMQKGA